MTYKSYELPTPNEAPDLYSHYKDNSSDMAHIGLSNFIRYQIKNGVLGEEFHNLIEFIDTKLDGNTGKKNILKSFNKHASPEFLPQIEAILKLQNNHITHDDLFSHNSHRSPIILDIMASQYLGDINMFLTNTGSYKLNKKDLIKPTNLRIHNLSPNPVKVRPIVAAVATGNLETLDNLLLEANDPLNIDDLRSDITNGENYLYEKAGGSDQGVLIIDHTSGIDGTIIGTAVSEYDNKKSELKTIERILSSDNKYLKCSDICYNIHTEDECIAKDHSSYLSNIFRSPMFKDTPANIKKLWEGASAGFKQIQRPILEYKRCYNRNSILQAQKASNVAEAIHRSRVR